MNARNSCLLPVSACLLADLCAGILYLWSIFNRPVAAAFSMTQSAAGMVSSYMLLAFVTGCLCGGTVCGRRGPRFTMALGVLMLGSGIGFTGALTAASAKMIYITYAMLGGLGSGFVYTACLGCIQRWFAARPGFASGLSAAAFGLSSVIFAPLCRWLMDLFTDAGTGLVNFHAVFPVLGGAFLLLGLAAAAFVRLPEASGTDAAASPRRSFYPDTMTPRGMIRKKEFWLIFFTIFFGAATWTLILPLISDLGVARGLSLTAATATLSLTGAVNTAGRLCLASLSDRIGRRATVVIFSLLTAAGALCLTAASGLWYSAAILLIAFAYGGPGPLAAAFAVDFFGTRNSARNFGLITLSLGCSSVVCNVISSAVLHGSPTATFLMAAAMSVVPIGLMAVLKRSERRNTAIRRFPVKTPDDLNKSA